ncbi:MAG: zinc ribbon domain-containing protein [Clostridia bacterium]|nr:zinc ribbon domain-containing protein [Clostridia bacterium]
MRYCRKCGNRLDDFDSYCGNCGAKVEDRASSFDGDTYKDSGGRKDTRTQVKDAVKSVENSLNDFTDEVSKNFESFLCLILGILSLTFGTFICAIVSLVFGKKAVEKGQDKDEQCAMFVKVGRICSKISIAFTIIAVIIFVICWIALPMIYGDVSSIIG